MIPFSARGKREWWENRWNWYVREYYQCSKCQQDEVLWPFRGRGWKKHKDKLQIQTIILTQPMWRLSMIILFKRIDEFQAWLLLKKNTCVTNVFLLFFMLILSIQVHLFASTLLIDLGNVAPDWVWTFAVNTTFLKLSYLIYVVLISWNFNFILLLLLRMLFYPTVKHYVTLLRKLLCYKDDDDDDYVMTVLLLSSLYLTWSLINSSW